MIISKRAAVIAAKAASLSVKAASLSAKIALGTLAIQFLICVPSAQAAKAVDPFQGRWFRIAGSPTWIRWDLNFVWLESESTEPVKLERSETFVRSNGRLFPTFMPAASTKASVLADTFKYASPQTDVILLRDHALLVERGGGAGLVNLDPKLNIGEVRSIPFLDGQTAFAFLEREAPGEQAGAARVRKLMVVDSANNVFDILIANPRAAARLKLSDVEILARDSGQSALDAFKFFGSSSTIVVSMFPDGTAMSDTYVASHRPKSLDLRSRIPSSEELFDEFFGPTFGGGTDFVPSSPSRALVLYKGPGGEPKERVVPMADAELAARSAARLMLAPPRFGAQMETNPLSIKEIHSRPGWVVVIDDIGAIWIGEENAFGELAHRADVLPAGTIDVRARADEKSVTVREDSIFVTTASGQREFPVARVLRRPALSCASFFTAASL